MDDRYEEQGRRGAMNWYDEEVRALERQHRHARGGQGIVLYGSSTFRLWSTAARDLGAPGLLNLGFGGSTLAACDHYFDRLVTPLAPRSLVVYAGDNDLGDGRSAGDVFRSFLSLRRKAAWLPGASAFTFVSIKPSPARWHLTNVIREANSRIRAEMARQADGLFLDIFPLMLNADGHPRPELYDADGLHLSERGYQLWTTAFLRHAEHLFTVSSPMKPA